MSHITIVRTTERVNSLRNYEIFIDNEKIEVITAGEEKTIELSPGNHNIYIKIDWCKSKPLNITLAEGQELKLKCGSKLIGIRSLLAIFYLFSPSQWVYLDYLSDNEVIYNDKGIGTWSQLKRKGKRNFILSYGILRFGIPMGIIFSALMKLNHQATSLKGLLISLLIDMLLFSLVGGSLFGLTMWEMAKRKNTNSI